MLNGEATSGRTTRVRVRTRSSGADCPVIVMKPSNVGGAKGAGHSRPIKLVNWQQEEPTDRGEEQQLFMDGTSRVSREAQARFREGLGVKLPGATRPSTELISHT